MLKGIVPNHCTTNPGHKFMSLCIHEFGELGKELVQRFFFLMAQDQRQFLKERHFSNFISIQNTKILLQKIFASKQCIELFLK